MLVYQHLSINRELKDVLVIFVTILQIHVQYGKKRNIEMKNVFTLIVLVYQISLKELAIVRLVREKVRHGKSCVIHILVTYIFQRITLDEESKNVTSFSTEKGSFRFNSIPFGLKIGPNSFQRMMSIAFSGLS